MKNPNWTRRSLSLLLAAVLTLLCAWVPGAAAQTAQELEKEMQKIEERIDAQEKKVAQLKKDQASQEKLLPALDEEIEAVEAKAELINKEIVRLNASVEDMNRRIRALGEEIAGCEAQIDEITEETEARDEQIKGLQGELMERLRQQYMAGPVSNLQLLLSSPDIASLLTISEYINRQAEEDGRLRSDIEDEMARLKTLQDELKAQQAELEVKKTDYQKQSAALVGEVLKQQEERNKLDEQLNKIGRARKEINDIIAGLKKETTEARRIIDKEQRALAAAEARLDALTAQKLQSGQIQDVSNDGKMIWPFPYRNCYITSNFGAKESIRNHAHRGIDISIADKSKNYSIIAALDGTIADHGYNGSMGNYVVIHHGYYAPTDKRIKTTYMHLKSFDPAVADNAFVKAGKVIGIMGNTGNSTGPHLHFQVNEYTSDKNSVPVDPLKYVKNPYK